MEENKKEIDKLNNNTNQLQESIKEKEKILNKSKKIQMIIRSLTKK